jgi:hypothetical protein
LLYLHALASKGRIQVTLNGNGFTNWTLSNSDLVALAAKIAPEPVRAMATADLPANTDVPIGTVMFDTTLATLVTNDGAAWV